LSVNHTGLLPPGGQVAQFDLLLSDPELIYIHLNEASLWAKLGVVLQLAFS